MILQSTISPSQLNSFTSQFSSPSLFPNGSHSLMPLPFSSVSRTNKCNNISIRCSISQIHSYGTTDFEKRPVLTWSSIYKMINTMEDPQKGVSSVLNKCENQGKRMSKWELSRIIKELRKFKKFNLALEVYEWMNNRIERFRISSSDTAIQLDLVAKVRGLAYAEDYFTRVPDTLKDNRIYGALLNAYVKAKRKQKAETLMEQMRNKGYDIHPLPYNVMMTLYMKFNEFDKVDVLISEMKLKSIKLDLYTYNIWLSARGSRGSPELMDQVFEEMVLDPSIVPNWTTFSTMASMYVKMGLVEKAEQCLRDLETRVTGRDRMPYHYLISIWGSLGNLEEVNRVWSVYKSGFSSIPNWGYHSVISSLLRSGDVAGAEKLYEEWLPVKTSYDPRVGNLLMAWYVKEEPFEKLKGFFDRMIETGGKPNGSTWEFLAEAHLKEGRITEALACFKESLTAEGVRTWRLKPSNVNTFMELCDQDNKQDSKEDFVGLLTQMGCLQDEEYLSYLTGFTGTELKLESTDEQAMFNDRSDAENDVENEILASVAE